MLANVLREYKINKILLSCLGLWPFQHKLARRVLSVFCVTVAISYLPFEIATFYVHRHNGQMIAECLYQMVVTTAFLVKMLNQIWNRDKFRRLCTIMENHWNIFTNELEARILKNYSNIAHKFTVFYSVTLYVMAIMFIMIPSLGPMFLDVVLPLNESRSRNFAVYAEYGIDQNRYFVSIFLYTSVMIFVGVSIIVATDTMHVACTAHACGLFQLIGRQIENIISDVRTDEEISKTECCMGTRYKLFNEELIYREYVLCLKKHQLALEYVNMLNATHRIVGISFVLLIAAAFSLTGARIVYVLDQVEEMIRFTFIIVGALLQLIIACYSGQKLMDESQNIFHQAYAAEWYNFSPRLKSLLSIILYRSIVPCKLMAGNMFPLSMAVFTGVIRTAMSYFTAFLSLKE